tara:strand:+ start:1314 stop:2348 length:1035 start_codon:yes stop_codon:yes gene_type:complete
MKAVKMLLMVAALCLAPEAKAQDFTIARTAAEAKVQLWDWSPKAKHQAAAVRLRSGSAGGSGVCVWSNGRTLIVLTAAHVVEAPGPVTIYWQDGKTATGKVIGADRTNDIAVIQCSFLGNVTTIPIATDPPPEGVKVEILGFGGPRDTLRRFYGKVIGTGNKVEAQAYLLSGDSGSGMIYGGNVVGIARGGPYLSQGVIDARGNKWSLVHPAGGASCRPIAALVGRCAPFCIPGRSTEPRAEPSAYPPVAGNQPGPVSDSIDYDLLAQKVAELLAEDERIRGPAGKDGAPGKGIELNLDQLSKEVDKRLPPLTIQIIDRNGKVLSSESRRLGEKLQILFQPKEK